MVVDEFSNELVQLRKELKNIDATIKDMQKKIDWPELANDHLEQYAR